MESRRGRVCAPVCQHLQVWQHTRTTSLPDHLPLFLELWCRYSPNPLMAVWPCCRPPLRCTAVVIAVRSLSALPPVINTCKSALRSFRNSSLLFSIKVF